MPDVMAKSYQVTCKRQGRWLPLETVAHYTQALALARTAIGNPRNDEVRVIEAVYDHKTGKDKVTIAKILTASDRTAPTAARVVSADAAVRAPIDMRAAINNVTIIIVLLTVLAVVGGFFARKVLDYWGG